MAKHQIELSGEFETSILIKAMLNLIDRQSHTVQMELIHSAGEKAKIEAEHAASEKAEKESDDFGFSVRPLSGNRWYQSIIKKMEEGFKFKKLLSDCRIYVELHLIEARP